MNDFIQKLFSETPMGGFQGLDLVQIDSNDHMFLLSVRILRSLNDRETDILVHTAAKVMLREPPTPTNSTVHL